MNEKELGKISAASLEVIDGRLGLHLTLSGESWGCQHSIWTWSPSQVEITEYTKWTEEDRESKMILIMREIDKLMKESNVSNLKDLNGIPIEVEFEGNTFKDFRILTEVL